MNLPIDLKAEAMISHLSPYGGKIEFRGTHMRNAYEDIMSYETDDGVPTIGLCRESLYDILPEAMFHPVDRFENIPANEYKERFAEECERQQIEEAHARKYFAPFDRYIFDLSSECHRIKNEYFSGNEILSDIISDNMPDEYRQNRFVKKMMPYLPSCGRLRGDKDMMALLLRRILKDEGIILCEQKKRTLFTDATPMYNTRIDSEYDNSCRYYLGNEFYELETEYMVSYWNDAECNDQFLHFIEDMKIFERFLNDYFVGVESSIKFRIETDALPVRLSDEYYHNYLEYNTNI